MCRVVHAGGARRGGWRLSRKRKAQHTVVMTVSGPGGGLGALAAHLPAPRAVPVNTCEMHGHTKSCPAACARVATRTQNAGFVVETHHGAPCIGKQAGQLQGEHLVAQLAGAVGRVGAADERARARACVDTDTYTHGRNVVGSAPAG
jgi:hypothetical protein